MAQFDYQSLITQLSADGFNSGEFVRQLVERGYQELIDAGAQAHIGAGPHERTSARKNQRNGSRKRTLATQAGDITIAMPKPRTGSYYPEFMERRRRTDKALYAVVMTAYIEGVSTRKVDELVKSLGIGSGVSRSEVSRICQGIDAMVSVFRQRDLSGRGYPYLYVDATYVKARSGHAVRSRAAIDRDGGKRRREARAAGPGDRPRRGPGLLGGLPAVPDRARPYGREAGDIRRPPRHRRGGGENPARCGLAGLSHPLRQEHRPQGQAIAAPAGDGRLRLDLYPARPRTRGVHLPRVRRGHGAAGSAPG